MTTIAYRDGVLACDSQTTGGGSGVSYRSIKAVVIKGVGFAAAGSASRALEYLRWARCGAKGGGPKCGDDDVFVLIHPDGRVFEKFSDGWSLSDGDFHAWGSGQACALGAMAAGASAQAAVRAAARLDVYTGGPIKAMRIGFAQ